MLHITQPWPWYVAGVVAGLTVPALLLLGNKHFGISANLRHVCAACIPGRVRFFDYNWKKEMWNLFFAAGIIVGGYLASQYLSTSDPVVLHPDLKKELALYGITEHAGLLPKQLFSLETLFSLKGFLLFIVGGFLVGFGARYAGGCTSGHAIMGLSTLQWPSLVATISFMIGGLIMANIVLPLILSL